MVASPRVDSKPSSFSPPFPLLLSLDSQLVQSRIVWNGQIILSHRIEDRAIARYSNINPLTSLSEAESP